MPSKNLSVELAKNPLFSTLETEQRERLIESGNPQNYPAGQWITHYGSSWPYLFYVEEGLVEALKESPEGRSLVIMELEKGMVFWGIGFFKEGVGMPVAFIAKENSRLLLWSREQLLPLLLDNGFFSWELSKLMVERMLRASEIVEELAFQPVAARLALFLLEQFGDRAGDTVTRDLTLDEMAARIGSTREMVCRQLYKLADKGMIQINRTELKITNLRSLQDAAESWKGGDR
ncbi:MAG: Crp/Fnr family transcriptional regulator [Anaerolineales bacterium]|nr:Crp/Fnr family transcriptional regulator [Anaerolineales bacterium]